MSGADWLALGMFTLGALWAIPAWYFGKATGIKYAMNALRHGRKPR